MAWIYKSSTGEIFHDSVRIGSGYSGFGSGRNNPLWSKIQNVGPIPEGSYMIGDATDTKTHGPHVMPLTPDSTNVMWGRGGFLIHGDSQEHPGLSSRGCIILGRFIRDQISDSEDKILNVIA